MRRISRTREARKHSLNAAISMVRKNHPTVVKMDNSQFKQWVVKTATVSGTPFASKVEVKDSTLKLSVDDANLRARRAQPRPARYHQRRDGGTLRLRRAH